ncbi:rRNA-processing protein and EBNA1-binding protein ebp2 [Tulasnella sp. JGI-2019a]|nr:rRNA-processing protein and EBNA1-binding protein ebp2 [Tulasnella sp. JGI-2019a]
MPKDKQKSKRSAPVVASASKKYSEAPAKTKAIPDLAPVDDANNSENEEHEAGDEEDEDEDDVDEEGIERLMKALGDDGLDDFAKAQLALVSDDDEDDEGDGGSDVDSEEDEDGEEAPGSDDDAEEDGIIFMNGEAEDTASGDDDEDDEDDEDGMNIDGDVAEAADVLPKVVVNNKVALQRIRDTIKLDSTLPWTETLVTTYPETLDTVDHNDDLNREVAFYKQALHCAQQSRTLAQKHSLPFTRPGDYFAEMVKSDIHMERIRTKLLDESAAIKKSEEAKKQRILKKYGKQIQMDRIKERAKDKRDMLESIKSLKRKRGGVENLQDDDAFDIALDDTSERPLKRTDSGDIGRGRGRGRGRGKDGAAKLPRQARDAKFQWGSGGNRHAKSNTRESTDSYDARGRGRGRGGGKFGGRGGGRGGASSSRGGAKRLGKSRRNK